MKKLIFILFLSVAAGSVRAQHVETDDYTAPSGMSDDDESPAFFVTVQGGSSIPQGSFSNSADFRESPDGFSLPGYSITASASYRFDYFLGLRSQFRYSQNPVDNASVSADLTRTKVGGYTADVDHWRFVSAAFGPEMSINNDQTFLNFFLLGGMMRTNLPGFQLLGDHSHTGDEVIIIGNPQSAAAFTFVFGTEFKYAFNSRFGISMSADYSTAQFNFRNIEYQTVNSGYDPDFKQYLNTAYSSLTVEAGVFYCITK